MDDPFIFFSLSFFFQNELKKNQKKLSLPCSPSSPPFSYKEEKRGKKQKPEKQNEKEIRKEKKGKEKEKNGCSVCVCVCVSHPFSRPSIKSRRRSSGAKSDTLKKLVLRASREPKLTATV